MQQIYQDVLTQSQHNVKIPTSNLAGLMLQFVGTNSAGQQVNDADFGTIELFDGNKSEFVQDLAYFGQSNPIYGGNMVHTSNLAGSFDMQYFIPFSLLGVSNPELYSGRFFDEKENPVLQINFAGTLSAKLQAGVSQSVRVVAVYTVNPEIYRVKFQKFSKTIPASTSNNNITIDVAKNINRLFLRSTVVSQLDRVQVMEDGKSVFNAVSSILVNATNFFNKIEDVATVPSVISLDLNQAGSQAGIYNDTVSLIIDSNATGSNLIVDLEVVQPSDDERIARSTNWINNWLNVG